MNDLLKLELDGLKETQANLLMALEGVKPGGGLRAVMAKAVLRAHRYVSQIVHVISGRLKNSLFPTVEGQGNNVYGIIGTNVVYAPAEHARTTLTGKEQPPGGHDFFARTVNEDGPGIIAQAQNDIYRGWSK